jgi:protein-tyrosine phosphatase
MKKIKMNLYLTVFINTVRYKEYEMKKITSTQLFNLSISEGYLLLDLRTIEEYCLKHVTSSINIPLFLSRDEKYKRYSEIFDHYCPENYQPVIFIISKESEISSIHTGFSFLKNFKTVFFLDMKEWPEFLSSNSGNNSIENIYTEFDLLKPYPSKILKNIYLGNRDNTYSNYVIKNLKITHILSLNKDANYKHNISKLNYPIEDDEEENIILAYSMVKYFLEEAFSKGILLINCDKGKSRSASILILFLGEKLKCNFEELLSFLKEKRKIVEPNPGFVYQIKKYLNTVK